MTRLIIFLVVLSLIVGLVVMLGIGRDVDETGPTMDNVERTLETDRHERLLGRIAMDDATLNAFTTDGCSGGLSLAWEQLSEQFPELAARHGNRPPWEQCCVVHDRQYHAGGSTATSAIESFDQRRASDLQLKACVVNTGAERAGTLRDVYGLSDQQIEILYQTISDLMYRAIRLGGIPCTRQPWRWGYGWPECS